MVNFLDDTLFDIDGYSCSDSKLFPLFQAIKFIIVIIQIAVPFALIIWGSLDWFKALIAHDEKEMRIKRKPFIARVVAAFIILLLPVLIQLIAKAFAGAEKTSQFWTCYSEAQPKIDFRSWQNSYSYGSSSSGRPGAKPEAGNNSSSGSSGTKPEAGNNSSSGSGNVNATSGSHSGEKGDTKHCYEYTESTCPPEDDYGVACKSFLKRCATMEEYKNAMEISGDGSR